MSERLADKVAIVTGAGQTEGRQIGNGRATAIAFAREGATVVLADPNVSRAHAEIRPQGTGYTLVDLGSTNGTRVNGARISTQALRDGDEIMFGNTRIRFEAN